MFNIAVVSISHYVQVGRVMRLVISSCEVCGKTLARNLGGSRIIEEIDERIPMSRRMTCYVIIT